MENRESLAALVAALEGPVERVRLRLGDAPEARKEALELLDQAIASLDAADPPISAPLEVCQPRLPTARWASL